MEPVTYNPQNVEPSGLPVIYAFSNARDGDGVAYAMAEDGTVLGSHWCSAEGYVMCDLAVLPGWREDRHEDYRKHYPNGYRMEFVAIRDLRSHAGLMAAWKLNQEAGERAASTTTTRQASGFCSAHQPPDYDPACSICYPEPQS